MSRVFSGVVAAAVWLLVTGCGTENKIDGKRLNGENQKTAEGEALKQSPVKSAQSCDLLARAIGSETGWVMVKRGKEEFKAHSIAMSAELITVMKGRDASFDPSRQCVQLLKKGDATLVEIAPETCGKDGVLGEERNGLIRLNVGKLLPFQAAIVAGEKGKQTPVTACTSSRYELRNSPAKGENQLTGELLINLITKMVAGEPQAQTQKGKSEPVMVAKESFEYFLTKFETVKPKVEESKQPQTKVEPQNPKSEPQVKGQPEAQKVQNPPKVEAPKVQNPPKVEAPKVQPPVKVETPKAPQKPVVQGEEIQKQKPAPIIPQHPVKP